MTCVKGNWVNSFDRKGWSACPKEYPFISGLERSLAALRFLDFILHLEGAECCSTTAVSYECTVVSLIGTIRRFVLSVFLCNLKLNYLYQLLTIIFSFSFYLPYFHFVFFWLISVSHLPICLFLSFLLLNVFLHFFIFHRFFFIGFFFYSYTLSSSLFIFSLNLSVYHIFPLLTLFLGLILGTYVLVDTS